MAKRNNVKELRLQKGWSQEILASLIGVSQYTVSEIENHRHNISKTELKNLAKAFEIKPSEIYPDP
jgi:putative transcriptional regulator